ncbi:MAG: Gfo/Idh/MocA family oxidoreductase, partial [Phycisphaerales bacterium]
MRHPSSIQLGSVSRRQFIKTSATGMAATLVGKNVIFAASAKPKFRVGLIGCGGRGNGALDNCHEAAEIIGAELEVVATADWFKDRAEAAGKKYNVPVSRCFGGATAYKKLLDTNVDVVLIATSPNFRPVHFEAAVNAGKHVFMEKPVAVDPPGGRRIIASGKVAKRRGLAVVAGTQRRHQAGYQRIHHAVQHGAIGDIASGAVYWCGGALWYRAKGPRESDADYMVRNW